MAHTVRTADQILEDDLRKAGKSDEFIKEVLEAREAARDPDRWTGKLTVQQLLAPDQKLIEIMSIAGWEGGTTPIEWRVARNQQSITLRKVSE